METCSSTLMCLTILYMQDAILMATKVVHGTIGSDVELMCTIEPSKGNISWLGPPKATLYAVGNEVNTDRKSFTEVIVSDHSKLKIKGLSTDKEGLYSCFAKKTEEKFEIKIKKNPSNLRVVNETDKGLIYGREGTDLSLECTVNRGEPGGNITWTDDDHVYAVNGPEHVYHRFRPGRSDHNKVFKCTAYNSEGETVESHNVKLFIFYKPEVTISPQPSRVLWEGQDLKLNCRYDGNDPDARIEWTRNGTKIPQNDTTLKFKGVKRQEAGEYTCEVHTKRGHGDSSISIEIQYPPNVTIKKRQPDNNTSILECIANGVPNKYLFSKWEHKTEWLDHVRFIEGSNNGHLTIQNDPSKENGYYQNSGIYVCNVSNNISDLSGSIHQSAVIDLKLQGRPIFLSANKQKQHAIYGREGVIQLFLFSNPKYESLTMFSGKQSFRLQSDNTRKKYYLAENEGPILDKIHGSLVNVSAYTISVRINQITESDFGNHTINATNSWGTAAFTVRLISAHKPEPPINVSAKPDTNIIRVFWNGGFDGGYSQTFVLQYRKLGVSSENEWTRFGEINDARQETYSTAIEGLEFDMQYIVCIFAYNVMNSSEIKCTDPVKTDLAESTSMDLVYGLSSMVFGVVVTFLLVMLHHKYKVGVVLHTSCTQFTESTPDPDEEYRVMFSPIEPFAASNQLYSSFSGPHAGFLMDQNVSVVESPVLDRDSYGEKEQDCNGGKVKDRTNHIFENEYHHPQDKDGSELNYVEISFDQVQKRQKFYIHGNADRTPYADIDLSIKADPHTESETESGDDGKYP